MAEIAKKPWYLRFIPKNAWHIILDMLLNFIAPMITKTPSKLDDEALKMFKELGHKAIDLYL